MGQDKAAAVERLIAPSLNAAGYEIVRVAFVGGPNGALQIMIERSDRRPLSVDDCVDVSRTVSALLDVEDSIAGPYTLEVSSPGIDRPLTRPEDFTRFAGFEAKLETRAPIDGRKRFRGRLLGLEGDLGQALGLDNKWAYNVVKQVGNFGEMWDRDIAPTGVPRGINNIWTKGGLQYAPPIR